MDRPTFSERRRFDRILVSVPARLLDVASNRESTAITRDISAQGVGLITREGLPANTYLEVWLEMPYRANPLHIQGRVAWSEEIEEGRYRMGVSLDKPQFFGMALILEQNHTR